MQLVPVLDIQGGHVVRAVGGDRDNYEPLRSRLTDATDAVGVANALRETLGCEQLYVADLDALKGRESQSEVVEELISEGFRLLLDAGAAGLTPADDRVSSGVDIVCPLEVSPSEETLAELVSTRGAERVVFSLDLWNGTPLGSLGPPTPSMYNVLKTVQRVIRLGIRRLIVLDLPAVGRENGCPTAELCRSIRNAHSDIEILTGGGVRSAADVRALEDAGVDGVLLSSVLHAGPASVEEIRRWFEA